MRNVMGSSSARDNERLLALTRELVARCPIDLGGEVAVTGSVGAGLADKLSDIELLFLATPVPSVERVQEWLGGVSGADDVMVWGEEGDVSAWFRVGDVEVDPYWGSLHDAVEEVAAITSGTVVEHRRIAFGHVLLHSAFIRTSGVLPELAQRCVVYPVGLKERLIADALWLWAIPAARVGAVARGDVVEARSWLQRDAEMILRLVFALNERWEPPRWKWLRMYVRDLSITPPRLVERLEEALLIADLAVASSGLAQLALDVLMLLPPSLARKRAQRGLEIRIAALAPETAEVGR
jgi:Domain of unknown function (DUF4037)